jgi:hypothetical protein
MLGMATIILILLIWIIVHSAKLSGMKKKYNIFMKGEDAKSLEDTLIKRLELLDQLQHSNDANREDINQLIENQKITFQKCGMVKYDAFKEMGGKLSFSLALLTKENDGILLTAMHTREGCYTYIKDIIKGESVLILAEEEKEALEMALNGTNV